MEKNILAFVHINKAAGTTLTHILRLNFFLKHFDVPSFMSSSDGVFQKDGMKKILRINPFIRSIAGHRIRSYSNISDLYQDVRYITLLRDPVRRTISHYQYNVEKQGANLSFDEYLTHDASFNRQTRIVAGTADLNLAKEMLKENFFLVGIVEEFDEFLIHLKKKLLPFQLKINYRLQNVSKKNSAIRKNIDKEIDQYYKKIVNRNKLDLELYNYVKNNLLPEEKRIYGPKFDFEVDRQKKIKKKYPRAMLRYIDYIFRKCYIRPMVRIRK